ncbi:zinc-binding dehydrogenase, partial [Propylenella binzhouense]
GVGIAAVQVARLRGAVAVATASRPEKLAALASFGAVAVNYRQDDVAAAARAACPDGVDVVLDLAGADHAATSIAALRPRGRIVHISSGSAPAIGLPLRDLMAKEAQVTGGLLRPQPLARKAAFAERLRAELLPEIGRGIRPLVDTVFPLEDAAEAHRRIESRAAIGKVVLVPGAG